jgi:hypothetical protein
MAPSGKLHPGAGATGGCLLQGRVMIIIAYRSRDAGHSLPPYLQPVCVDFSPLLCGFRLSFGEQIPTPNAAPGGVSAAARNCAHAQQTEPYRTS